MPDPWPNMSPRKGTASPPTPTKLATVLPTSPSDVNPILSNHEWYSYSITTVIAPEQLSIQQDLSLSESKQIPDPDIEMSKDEGKPTPLMESPGELGHFRRDDDECQSSGDPTPASEAWEYWEEIPELRTYNIDSETLMEALKDPLNTLFEEWVEQAHCDDGGGEESSSASSSSALRSSDQQPAESKRKRINNPEDEEPDRRPTKLRTTEKRSRKLMPLHKSLACPYFKKDPRRHRACCGFGFSKISYVKAHLYRKHAIPIYCPVCRESFENVQLRDDHSRERNCEAAQNGIAPDGITSEQRDWLHQRGPRNFTEEEHWFRIFEFLFPGNPWPRSAYNDTTFSEDLLNFRDYISAPAAQDILLQRVRENSSWTAELEAIFRPDLVHGLDQLYWRWAAAGSHGTGSAPAIESPSQETGTSSAYSENNTVNAPASQPEMRPGHNSPGLEIATEEAPERTTSVTLDRLEQDVGPHLEESEALAFDGFELEERKVDEEYQLPPRQLNHDGIDLVLDECQWQPADLSGLEYTDYDPLAVMNDIHYGIFEEDFALLNPPDDAGGAEEWVSNLDLPGSESSLDLQGQGAPPPVQSPANTQVESTPKDKAGSAAEQAGGFDDFVMIPQPRT